MKILFCILQVIAIIILAPGLSGLIRKIKNNLRMRKGSPVLQSYFNFFKLLKKDEVVSNHASWIFGFTPLVVLGSAVTASFLVPFFAPTLGINFMGDLIALVFILALGRFFLALSSLDTASAFGGMGASREMFISSFAEPVALLAIFTVSLNSGSTSLTTIAGAANAFKLSTLIAAIALFIVLIAETSRIPVDNQETHLELTMVHEAMVLEYSGRSLALLELAASIKQIIFFTLLVNLFCPFGGIITYPIKILVLACVIAVTEVTLAKMRLFRVVDLLVFSVALGLFAVIAWAIGV